MICMYMYSKDSQLQIFTSFLPFDRLFLWEIHLFLACCYQCFQSTYKGSEIERVFSVGCVNDATIGIFLTLVVNQEKLK